MDDADEAEPGKDIWGKLISKIPPSTDDEAMNFRIYKFPSFLFRFRANVVHRLEIADSFHEKPASGESVISVKRSTCPGPLLAHTHTAHGIPHNLLCRGAGFGFNFSPH